MHMPLPRLITEPIVRNALLEDLGSAGDVTSDAVIPGSHQSQVALVARKAGVIAGLDIASLAFSLVDGRIDMRCAVNDGDAVEAGQTLALVEGPSRAIMTAERTALNFLGHLSGIATVTASIVAAIAGTGASVACTRKTTPGLRALEKYAVRAGGGKNHRFALYDAILIKDNHVAVAGSVQEAVQRARRAAGHMVKIEVEVDTLDQLEEAMRQQVDAVLLDNMDLPTLRNAVEMVSGRAITEASGGITPSSAAAVASTGVDLLSVGWITHSAPTLDLGLDFLSSRPGV